MAMDIGKHFSDTSQVKVASGLLVDRINQRFRSEKVSNPPVTGQYMDEMPSPPGSAPAQLLEFDARAKKIGYSDDLQGGWPTTIPKGIPSLARISGQSNA